MLKITVILCLVLQIFSLPVEENNSGKLLKDADPELLGGGFEGDIILPPDFDPSRGVAIFGAQRRWPNNTIPYDISAITNTSDRTMIVNAMNQLMYDVGTPITGQQGRKVCVHFRQAQPNDKEILKIQYGQGCSASVGYSKGVLKTLNLQPVGCFVSGIIQHELTHVLGFFHEQSRPDRDSYIQILHDNIIPETLHNFEKYNWNTNVESQGFNYDYGSLMHYRADAFTKNGKPTIKTVQPNAKIGQREKLSATDILEIRHYYKC